MVTAPGQLAKHYAPAKLLRLKETEQRAAEEARLAAAIAQREMLVKVKDPLAGEMHVPGLSIKLSKTPGRLGPVPVAGEHTEALLSALPGYDQGKLAQLRTAKVIQ